MYEIEMQKADREFAECWQAAGEHLQNRAQDGKLSWLKADLIPPFLEHFSFRVGNQLFFIRVEDYDNGLTVPGSMKGLLSIAEGCEGHACRMPMRRFASSWEPVHPGWGLVDAKTGFLIDPINLITDEKIEMTRWELHDFGVQVVGDYIQETLGYELTSSQGNPDVDPSIWYVGDKGPEWVVVRVVRYPEREATVPRNIDKIAEHCARLGRFGHFASISVANADDAFDPTGDVPALPLWRGHAMHVRFEGLAPATMM